MRVTLHRGLVEVDASRNVGALVFELARSRKDDEHGWFVPSSPDRGGGPDSPAVALSYEDTLMLAEYHVNQHTFQVLDAEWPIHRIGSFRSLPSEKDEEEVHGVFFITCKDAVWEMAFIKVTPGEQYSLKPEFVIKLPDYDPMIILNRESLPEPEPTERFDREII